MDDDGVLSDDGLDDAERAALQLVDRWVTARVCPGEDQPLLEAEGYLQVWSALTGHLVFNVNGFGVLPETVAECDSEERVPRVEPIRDEVMEGLFRVVDDIARPLIEHGWSVTDRIADNSWDYGPAAICDYERAGTRIELEYRSRGILIVFPIEEKDEDDDEETEPLFTVDEPTSTGVTVLFRQHGWL